MATRSKNDTTPSGDTSPEGDTAGRDTGDTARRDTAQGDATPEGYERGHVALAGGAVVAFGATVKDALRESGAAGHERPVIVAGMRPAPEGDQ